MQFFKTAMNNLEAKYREARGSLVEAQVSGSMNKEELDKVSKQNKVWCVCVLLIFENI